MRNVWLVFGLAAFGVGLLGIVLPLVPATVFMVIAAWAFGRSSPRLQRWILKNRFVGPPVNDWRDHGIIRRNPKIAAVFGLVLSLGAGLAIGAPAYVLWVQAVLLTVVAVLVVTRPENPPG